jgi:hypothetical protein
MPNDVRDKPFLKQDDILGLNFIRAPGTYVFKRYYRAGLRSHIMEVLKREDWEKESSGVQRKGLTWFPRARPVRMLRIFRTRFETLKQAEEELERVKVLETYLAPDHIARSEEFLVSYRVAEKWERVLCGLQEYVDGEILDPWARFDMDYLVFLYSQMGLEDRGAGMKGFDRWIAVIRKKAANFIGKLKKMVRETRYLPDLAGIGNILLPRAGGIKLVDINNISRVSVGTAIQLDERGYPACDKSIEALSRLEASILGRAIRKDDPLYGPFLDPRRMKEVKALEEAFNPHGKPRSDGVME